MTVSSTTNKIQFNGNGVTVAFGFANVMFAASDLLVTLYNTSANADVSPAPVLNGGGTYDYTFAGTFDADKGEYVAGGTVTFNTAPITGYRVTIERVVPQTQGVTLIDNSKFPAETVNGALDRVTVLVQRAMQLVGQALYYPSSDPTTVTNILPDAATRGSMFLAFDASGNPVAATAATSSGTPFSTFWNTTVQIGTAALSRVALAINANAFVTQAAGDSTTLAATTAFVAAATGKVYIQTFTANGTYTPHAGMVNCIIECLGGGGGGGGTAGGGGTTSANGGGGGAGSMSTLLATAATIGASKAVTIGAAGAGGAAGSNPGTAGGDTSVGTLCIGKGGSGGSGILNANTNAAGGLGGVAGTGTLTPTGQPGGTGMSFSGSFGASGAGGSSPYGGGGRATTVAGAAVATGEAGTGKGSGGAGGVSYNGAGTAAGGAGTAGYVVIYEFCDR